MVVAADVEELAAVVAQLEGNLTGSIYSHTSGADDREYERVAAPLRGAWDGCSTIKCRPEWP